MRFNRREWLAIAFSVAVLMATAVFVFVGGSSQGDQSVVDLVGNGHSVMFSESTITIHRVKGGICSGQQGSVYFQNETDTTQQVVSKGEVAQLADTFTLSAGQGIGECIAAGTTTVTLQSNPRAKLSATVEGN
jgi:hypothetical protein